MMGLGEKRRELHLARENAFSSDAHHVAYSSCSSTQGTKLFSRSREDFIGEAIKLGIMLGVVSIY